MNKNTRIVTALTSFLCVLFSASCFAQCTNVGIYYWGGSLKATDSSTIVPTAKKLADSLHVNTIRLTLACNDDEVYRGTAGCLTGSNLTALASRPDFNAIITDPQFTTVIITAYDWVSYNDCATANFVDTAFYTPANTLAIESEFTNLANYLKGFPDKKFIISNWEGDNQCYCGAAYYYPTCAAAPENIAGFTKWMQARAAGINAAHAPNVKVGIEFCNIHSLEAAGKPDILDTVIPYVYSDYFLYSSYESINVSPAQTDSDISFIRNKLARFGKDSSALLIGEMGFGAIGWGSDSIAASKLQAIVNVINQRNIPTAIVWTLIDYPTDFAAYDSNQVLTNIGAVVKAAAEQSTALTLITAANATSCAGNNGAVMALVTSGPGPYSYNWSNDSSSAGIANLPPGTYTVTVTGLNGCTASDTAIVMASVKGVAAITAVHDTLYASAAQTYQWYYNNTLQAADTLPVLVATQNGAYYVVETDTGGCTDTSALQSISDIMGLEQLQTNNAVKVYPNPLQDGKLTVDASPKMIGATCQIFDASGKLIFSSLLTSLHSEISLNIEPGVYLVKIYSEQKSYALKLIKL